MGGEDMEQDTGSHGLDRRDFLKGALAAGAVSAVGAMAGCGSKDAAGSTAKAEAEPLTAESAASAKWAFEIPPAAVPDSKISKTVSTEIVVVGGGTSGLVCANAAAENGAKVVLVAASEGPVARGGSNFAFNTKTMEAAGIPPIDISRWFKVRMRDNLFRVDQDKWWTAARDSGEAMDWLNDKMVSAGNQITFEYNFTDPDGGALSTMAGTHGWIGGDIKQIGMGQPLVVAVLKAAAEKLGVDVSYSTEAVQLVRDDNNKGRVSAVIAKQGDNYVKYVGSKAIVLATGDFTGDKDMVAKYSPWSLQFDNGGVYKGAGHKMALWVGAAWQKTVPNAPMVVSLLGFMGTATSNGMCFTGLIVNKDCQRYSNEDCLSSFAGIAQARQPEQKAFAVWDSDYYANAGTWDPPAYGMPPKSAPEVVGQWDALSQAGPISAFAGMPEVTIYKADTLDALASKMGIDGAKLKETVNRYNGYCKTGVDEEFGKRAARLCPVSAGPFYGCSALPWRLIVTGGLRTNKDLQVLDETDAPVPGLYAVGTIVGDMIGSAYDFITPGMNLGLNCVTFGYRAGKGIASGAF